MPFATPYLCEAQFLLLFTLKSKYRSRMNAESDLRLKLTNITLNIEELCLTQQAYQLH